MHFVGDGNEKTQFIALAKTSNINYKFHGYLGKEAVFDIYQNSHFFLMPTNASEGFPKVIAEALNFGCIPIVSSVSAISQYVKHQENGFIISSISAEGLKNILDTILELKDLEYQKLLDNSQDFVERFTFGHYNNRILTEILS